MSSFIVVIVWCLGVFGLVGVSGEKNNYGVANERTNVDINLSLMQSSVFYGVLSESLVISKAVNEKCQQNMLQMLIGVNTKELWAIKALDASGTSRHSFVWGQNAWLGSKTECDYLNTPPLFSITTGLYKAMDPKLISAVAPMPVEFKMLFVNFSSPYKIDTIIHVNTLHRIGLCLPESCRNDEVMNVAQSFFSRQEMNFQKLFNVQAKIAMVRNMELNNFLQHPTVWHITVGILIVVLCVLSLGFFHDLKNDDKEESFSQCFSIVKNVKFITKPTTNISSLSVINGIKPFVCIWVIILHVTFYSMFAYDNVPSVLQTYDGVKNQPIYAGFFYVDIFFVLSAILLVFNFMTNETKMKAVRQSSTLVNLKTFGQAVLHRYLRLTPALIFTIAVSHLLSLYIKEVSSFYIDSKFDLVCTQSGWWHSVFYIQNLFYVYDLCLSWSWYLACDMQFYVIVLLLLYVYAKYPKIAVFLYSCLLLSALGISLHVCLQADANSKMDSILANLGVFYIPPWTRAHPYMAGIFTGYIMVQLKDKPLKLKNWVVRSYWSIATLIYIFTLFVTYDKNISILMFAISYSVGRLLLALFWGSTIIMCYLGHGGIFNRFFSSQIFAHLNKLAYMMYLLNPVIITVIRTGSESSSHFDVISMITDVICTVLLTYVFAFFLAPIFEIPFQRLSDRYVMQKRKIINKK